MKHLRFLALSTIVLLPLIANALSPRFLFLDVPAEAWFFSSVEQAVDLGIVSGYKDAQGNPTGTFGPENSVTFAEALKIAIESAGYDSNLGQGYGHWAAKYLSIAIGERFSLTPNQNVDLDRPATRSEVASLIADAFRVQMPPYFIPAFTDVSASNRFAFDIQALQRDAILSGDTDTAGNATGRFRPESTINRAEMVKIAVAARTFYSLEARSSSSSRSSSSGSGCVLSQCGEYPMGMPNWQCPDGSLGGPSCERLPDSRCGWLVRQCAPLSSSSRSSSFSSSRSSSVSSRHSSSSRSALPSVTVLYSLSGFSPSVIRVKVGQTVIFKNTTDDDEMWVASNPHPTHIGYSGFDQGTGVIKDGEYVFVFIQKGTWGYHNHLNTAKTGQIIVE